MRHSYINTTILIISFFVSSIINYSGKQHEELVVPFVVFVLLLFSSAWQAWKDFRAHVFSSGLNYAVVSLFALGFLAWSSRMDYAVPIGQVDQVFLLSLLAFLHLSVEGFVRKRATAVSFARSFNLYPIGLCIALLMAASLVAIQAFEAGAFYPVHLYYSMPMLAASNTFLSVAVFALAERSLLKRISLGNMQLYLAGKPQEKTSEGLFQQLHQVKTIIFPKHNFLSDGKHIYQAIDHRATMREQTVLNIFYQLFLHLDSTVAQSLEKQIEAPSEIAFEKIETRNGAVFATDDFGVAYRLGSYAIAKNFTQDDSFTYYLVRGNTLFGKMLFSDSPLMEQKIWIDAFNQRPMNTVLVSDDSEAACQKISTTLGLDKAYANLSDEEQLYIVSELEKRAYTAAVAQQKNKLEKTAVGFLLPSEKAAQELPTIWHLFEIAKAFRDTSRVWAFAMLFGCCLLVSLQLIFGLKLVQLFVCSVALQLLSFIVMPLQLAYKCKAQNTQTTN